MSGFSPRFLSYSTAICGFFVADFLSLGAGPTLKVRTHYDFKDRSLRIMRRVLPNPEPPGTPSGRGRTPEPGATLTPKGIDQVFTSIFDAVNNAMRINATLAPGGTHTPNNAEQVSLSVFDATNNALKVNCVLGCLATVRVDTDSPGQAYTGAGTITLTSGSTGITTSGGSWNGSNVGSILQYNGTGTAANCNAAITANTPCFRAVITSANASAGTFQLAVPYPGPNASNIAFNPGPSAGNFNTVADACGQANASIINHSSVFYDDRYVSGSQNCTVNPWNGAPYGASGYGQLAWGNVALDATRPWIVPANSEVYGLGRGGSGPINTFLFPDSSNWYQSYEALNVVSTNWTSNQTGNNFSDQPSSGNSTLMQTVASAACIGSGQFGQFTLTSALTGFVESLRVHFLNLGAWNGNWSLVAVSGLNGTVQFASACSAPTLGATSSADMLVGQMLQGSYVATTTGTSYTVASTSYSSLWTVTSNASDFASTDVGVSTLKATAGCTGSCVAGPFTVVAYTSATVVTIDTAGLGNPNWSAVTAIQKTEWLQSLVTATSFNSATQTATLTTIIPLQTTCASSCPSLTYSLAGCPLGGVPFAAGTAGGTVQGVRIHDLAVNMQGLTDGIAFSGTGMQEQSEVWNMQLSGWTASGYVCDVNCSHAGPLRAFSMTPANLAAPTSDCIEYVGSTNAAVRMVTGVSCTANLSSTQAVTVPYVAFEISAPAINLLGNHWERFGIGYSIGRFGTVGKSKGIFIGGNDPGASAYYHVALWNASNEDVVISGLGATNNAPALIADYNFSSSCGAGASNPTLLTDNGVASPGIALYALNTSSATATRFSSDSAATNCLGPSQAVSYATTSNCLLGGASGTISPAACGSAPAGKIAVPASQTSYTVNTTAVTANSEVLVQQVTDNSGLPSSPTCGSGLIAPIVSSRVAGTSFALATTSIATVTCFQYTLIN